MKLSLAAAWAVAHFATPLQSFVIPTGVAGALRVGHPTSLRTAATATFVQNRCAVLGSILWCAYDTSMKFTVRDCGVLRNQACVLAHWHLYSVVVAGIPVLCTRCGCRVLSRFVWYICGRVE